MKKTYIITGFLILLVSIGSFAQEVLTAAQIKTDLENSTESLSLTILLPDSDFHIGLVTDQLVENIHLNPCIDIKSDPNKNEKILNLLEKHKLLDDLFVEIDNLYKTPDFRKEFEPGKTVIYLELFLGVDKSVPQVFVPVFSKEKAKLLLTDLERIFGYGKCFKQLQKEIKT